MSGSPCSLQAKVETKLGWYSTRFSTIMYLYQLVSGAVKNAAIAGSRFLIRMGNGRLLSGPPEPQRCSMILKLRLGLVSAYILLVPSLSEAEGCSVTTVSAPLQAAIGGKKACVEIVQSRLCTPAGKAIRSSGVKEISVSSNVEIQNEVQNVGSNCIEVKITVRSRNVIGPPIWEFCREGSYAGRAELTYCR